MIQLYKSNKPNHGLVCVRGRWFLLFREDGIQRRIALNTTDETLARAHRDIAYEKLITEGAVFSDAKAGRPKTLSPGSAKLPPNVFYRKPYQARIGTKSLGYFDTAADALNRVDAEQSRDDGKGLPT